jgi:hypothetical protein
MPPTKAMKSPRDDMAAWSNLEPPLSPMHPNQVLTLIEWCRLNRISTRTGRRIIASGNGPPVLQLSAQRIGITVAANAKWQASRARTSL